MYNTFIEQEKNKEYYINLMKFLEEQYQNNVIYPPYNQIFNALELSLNKNLKVVIIGQDPYINEGQAHGLAFSVLSGTTPPSLKNIFKELESDLGVIRTDSNLTDWAMQGVLLFNPILTVVSHHSHSHKNIGWEIFSENLIKYLNANFPNLIYILWGSSAKKFKKVIASKYIIESVHPSPLSVYRGFYGSRPFSKCNAKLSELGKESINW